MAGDEAEGLGVTSADIEALLHGPFTEYAKEAGLSMVGERYKGGFMFYSMETKKAFSHYVAGYADRAAAEIRKRAD